MPTTQDAVVAKLKSWASFQDSETSVSATDLKDCADGGLAEHNSDYSYATLPSNQVELVVLLAWIRLTDLRAGRVAQQGDVSGGGFGSERNTPFQKLTKFAEALRKRYDNLCSKLGLPGSGSPSDVVVTNNRVKDSLTGEQIPSFAATPPPPIVLSEDTLITTEMVISWIFGAFDYFDSFILFQLTSDTETIYQAWNFTSVTSIPRIHNSALNIGQFYQQDLRSLKIEGIDRTHIQRFLMAARSMNGLVSYSNELLIPVLP